MTFRTSPSRCGPGRDLARLIEVAAFQTKLKSAGYNPAKELNDRLHRPDGGGSGQALELSWRRRRQLRLQYNRQESE